MMNADKIIAYLFLNNIRHQRFVFYSILFFLFPFFANGQNKCPINNQTFQDGEQLKYVINYNWGAIWMTTGEVTFSAALTDLNGKKVYHFTGLGGTYPKYDWFYKVRDKYESYADSATLKPIRFLREVYEGNNFAKDDYVFSWQKNKIYTAEQRNKKPGKFDSLAITACTNDVITAVFYARCMDFSNHNPNDTIPIVFILDGEIFNSYIRYLGKEVIYSKLLGNVRCIKFRPKLIEGTIFKGGEGMTVWVTDDKNKIPVYVETPIIVGTIKVDLNDYKGLRNPINCFAPK